MERGDGLRPAAVLQGNEVSETFLQFNRCLATVHVLLEYARDGRVLMKQRDGSEHAEDYQTDRDQRYRPENPPSQSGHLESPERIIKFRIHDCSFEGWLLSDQSDFATTMLAGHEPRRVGRWPHGSPTGYLLRHVSLPASSATIPIGFGWRHRSTGLVARHDSLEFAVII